MDNQEAQERAVGISVYVESDAPGFHCIVKQRYTDFLVNEILPDGQVLHLTGDADGHGKKRKRDVDKTARPQEQPVAKKANTDLSPTVDNADGADSHSAGQSSIEPALVKSEATELPNTSDQPNAQADKPSVAVDKDAAKDAASASVSDEDRTTLTRVFGERVSLAIIKLYANVCAFPDRKPRDHSTVISELISDKAQRTEAHTSIRRIFDSKLETLTIQAQNGTDSTISIKAAPTRAASAPRGNDRAKEMQRGKVAWEELGGEYLHFTLYKENKDTMEVLYFFASQLKLNMKHLTFAGTKDRRGVTVQRVAVHRVRHERMQDLNRLAKGWRISGPWEYKHEGLELGMLGGNEFLLTLRDVRLRSERPGLDAEQRLQQLQQVIDAAAQSLGQKGFINYYGLQRFGTHAVGTHVVGMKMLKGDLKGAVDAVLSYDPALVEMEAQLDLPYNNSGQSERPKVPRDDIARAVAIHAFTIGSPVAEVMSKLKALGNRYSAEKGMITHLVKRDRKTAKQVNPIDYQGALMQIQRNLRLMYVHAYQSLVWNLVAGKRWEQFGGQVVEGDLVVVGAKEREEGITIESSIPTDQVDDDGEPIVLPSASANIGTEDADPAAAAADDPFVRARPLTKSEVESGRYNIFDVVLPLPGFDVIYPKNTIGRFYEEFMGSEAGGGLDPHSMRRGWKDISLSGGYRKMMARPLGNGVRAELKTYSGDDDQMVETDLERLKRNPAAESNGSRSHRDATDGEVTVKDKMAVLLRLQLASSQYATMALRELTKGGAASFTPDYSVTNK